MRVITPFVVRSLPIAVVALACSGSVALADWGRVTITPTPASKPLVEGCSDGANGSFVAWQEGSPTGVLRAQHLLSTGIIDPAWPAGGAAVCDVAVARNELVAIPDRLGGVYVSWKEGSGLYVTRLDPSGAVASGWPARGRFLGGVFADSPRPVVIEDGAHGIYLGWGSSTSTALAIHIGPANTGAGGWPAAARAVSVGDLAYNTVYWPQIALAPDGGLFVAWAMSSTDEDAAPSAWRLRRIDSAGLNAAGWPAEGLSFGSFQREWLGSPIKASLVAMSPDGLGGVFLSIGNPVGNEPNNGAILESRLYRLQGNGETAVGWPVDGKPVSQASYYYFTEFGTTADFSYRVFPDAADGGLAGFPQSALHSGSNVSFAHCDDTGEFGFGWVAAAAPLGNEVAGDATNRYFVASFYPTGPMGPYQPYAYLAVRHTSPGWTDWNEIHFECCATFYGDIGLAATEDGGAVLFWSQVLDRIGLFAQHFNSAGAVVAVEPGPSVALEPMRLRFVSGAGVRAVITGPVSDRMRIELFDLAGRRLASQAIASEASVAREASRQEVTIAGTAALPSGLYFGRLVGGASTARGKLIVAR